MLEESLKKKHNYCVFVWVKNKINYTDTETLEIEYLMETLPPV